MRDNKLPDSKELEYIKNRIWLTSKTRMQSEKRYAMYDNVAHIILCIYSISLIGLTVFSNRLPATVPVDAYAIWFSVWVIVFSVVVFGFAFGKTSVLESVRKVVQFEQSLRSMRRIDASLRKASALRDRFSKSLANLRHRPSHAKVRSTTQRLGRTSKPLVIPPQNNGLQK